VERGIEIFYKKTAANSCCFCICFCTSLSLAFFAILTPVRHNQTKKRQNISRATLFFGILFVFGVLFFIYDNARAATVTWTGAGGNALWSNGANWSSGTKTGSGDIVYFDNTCTNCDVTIDQNITLTGLSMSATYTGTITQGGYTIDINGT